MNKYSFRKGSGGGHRYGKSLLRSPPSGPRGAPPRDWYHEPTHKSDLHRVSPQGEFVFGVQPVWAVLNAKKRSLFQLYIKEGDRKSSNLEGIMREYSSQTGQAPRYVDKQFFGAVFGEKVHQGIAIDVSPLEVEYMEALPKCSLSGPVPLWVGLDEIQDPQNFGSVLRSCSFFGVSGVVIPGKRTAPLSPTVSKASSGAMELIDIFEAINMKSFLQKSKDNGWCIIGTSSEGQEVDISSLQVTKPSIILFGNEAKGISPNLLSLCDVVVKIPTSTPNPQILDSLNVGVATGIFLYELHKKRRMGSEL